MQAEQMHADEVVVRFDLLESHCLPAMSALAVGMHREACGLCVELCFPMQG